MQVRRRLGVVVVTSNKGRARFDLCAGRLRNLFKRMRAQSRLLGDLHRAVRQGYGYAGIVLTKVKANRATYWKGREEGEVEL